MSGSRRRCERVATAILLYDADHQALVDAFDLRQAWLDAQFGRLLDLVYLGDWRESGRNFRVSLREARLLKHAESANAAVTKRYGTRTVANRNETARLAELCGVDRANLPCLLLHPTGMPDERLLVRIPASLTTSGPLARLVVDAVEKEFSVSLLERLTRLPPSEAAAKLGRSARSLEIDLKRKAGEPRGPRKGRRPTDPVGDKKIVEGWRSGSHKTKADLAQALGMPLGRVKHVIDRARKRPAE